ncbi:hypothetical protein [Shewanella psychrotolerans]|uniref:hypothetical protein n=1 Tax=Shewanella psychrotolerans TaxID=2864206 RepID=UPI001C659B16|nr:hypothetical protein [Shewanella psychrotolerans]QYK02418.1 hypothetical protein K0I62_05550 [Shewanella psychrotolerans]
MTDKKQNQIADMEAKLAHLKANHVDSPAQAKARRLIKPLFISIGVIFALIFIALIFSAGNEHKPEVETASSSSAPVKQTLETNDAKKWQAYQGVSDCELAYQIYSDYAPIISSLERFVSNNPDLTHQQVVQWKQSTKFDESINAIDEKYPAYYKVSMPNSLLAHGFSFSAGQYWRDIFSATRNGMPLVSEQTTLMQDDLRLLKANCNIEFGSYF